MLASIDFNDQSSLHADKVDNVATYRNLTAELVSTDVSIPKHGPQRSLCVGGFAPHSAGT